MAAQNTLLLYPGRKGKYIVQLVNSTCRDRADTQYVTMHKKISQNGQHGRMAKVRKQGRDDSIKQFSVERYVGWG